MEYQFSFESRPEYLLVEVAGDNTVETISRYTRQVRETCVRLGKTRVLIVVKLVGENLSLLDVYKAVAAGSDEAKNVGMRVAYVDPNPKRPTETMILAEDVAAARGIPVCTFRNVQEAEAWLVGPTG